LRRRDEDHSTTDSLIVVAMALAFAVLIGALASLTAAHAADPTGKFKDSPLHDWFNSLTSHRGLCCSFADGRSIADVDWDTTPNGYRVRVDGVWYDVPDEAVITEPNRAGTAIVFPYLDAAGQVQIRCFLPGSGT